MGTPTLDNRVRTLQEACTRALERDPDQPALEFEGRWYAWGDLRNIAEQVTALLDESGADPLAPIVFIPRNRPSALAAMIGMLAKGRSIRMVYAFQSPSGITREIMKGQPGAVVGGAQDIEGEVADALRDAGIAAISLRDDDAVAIDGCERTTARTEAGPSAPQVEVLTSGTTGPPKQFAFSYDLIADHMVSTNSIVAAPADPAATTPMFLFFPFGNISGIYATLPVLLHGIRGVLVDRFTLEGWRSYVARYRPAWVGLPAAAVQMILDAEIPAEELSCITTLSPAASAVDVAAQKAFQERYGIAVLPSYGATEFGGPVAMMTPALHAEWGAGKIGSVGRPYAGARLRVVDPQSGAELAPGEEGVLEVWTSRIGEHWIRTSDIAIIDEDGFLFHRGRADGAIVRGGFKLLPETIERALLEHQAVAAVSVVGVPDARLGEVPAAAVQHRPGVPVDVRELELHARERLPATHIPAHWQLVPDLPLTPSMKTDRSAVRRLFVTNDNS